MWNKITEKEPPLIEKEYLVVIDYRNKHQPPYIAIHKWRKYHEHRYWQWSCHDKQITHWSDLPTLPGES